LLEAFDGPLVVMVGLRREPSSTCAIRARCGDVSRARLSPAWPGPGPVAEAIAHVRTVGIETLRAVSTSGNAPVVDLFRSLPPAMRTSRSPAASRAWSRMLATATPPSSRRGLGSAATPTWSSPVLFGSGIRLFEGVDASRLWAHGSRLDEDAGRRQRIEWAAIREHGQDVGRLLL